MLQRMKSRTVKMSLVTAVCAVMGASGIAVAGPAAVHIPIPVTDPSLSGAIGTIVADPAKQAHVASIRTLIKGAMISGIPVTITPPSALPLKAVVMPEMNSAISSRVRLAQQALMQTASGGVADKIAPK